MPERPILMSSPMVRAILDDRKTQTRRVVKPMRGYEQFNVLRPELMKADYQVWWHHPDTEHYGVALDCPYGQIGDRLWVRENGWQPCEPSERQLRDGADTWPRYVYDADCITEEEAKDYKSWGWKRRPSIHMPRWASRITLEITGVRVERLQDISDEDIHAEGAITEEWETWREDAGAIGLPEGSRIENERDVWRNLWQSINGPESWAANPWVWAIEFKRVQP